MNVCNEGGPIVVFKEPPECRLAADDKTLQTAEGELLDHIRKREFAERAAAKRAASSAARRAHQELAQAYSRMTRGAAPAK